MRREKATLIIKEMSIFLDFGTVQMVPVRKALNHRNTPTSESTNSFDRREPEARNLAGYSTQEDGLGSIFIKLSTKGSMQLLFKGPMPHLELLELSNVRHMVLVLKALKIKRKRISSSCSKVSKATEARKHMAGLGSQKEDPEKHQ